MFKPEYLLFTAEIFLNAPSGKIKLCHFDNIFFGTDPFIGSQHYGMFRDAIDQDKVNIFSGSGDLHFHMGKIGIMVFAFIIKRCFYLTFTLVSQLCSWNPFPMKEKFASGSKTDDIILPHAVQLEEHLVIVIPPVHDEGSFPQKGGAALHCGKGHVIDGSEIFLF